MASVEAVVRLTTLSEPTPGAWCPVCLLPSGVSVTVAMEANGQATLVTVGRCVDCGALL